MGRTSHKGGRLSTWKRIDALLLLGYYDCHWSTAWKCQLYYILYWCPDSLQRRSRDPLRNPWGLLTSWTPSPLGNPIFRTTSEEQRPTLLSTFPMKRRGCSSTNSTQSLHLSSKEAYSNTQNFQTQRPPLYSWKANLQLLLMLLLSLRFQNRSKHLKSLICPNTDSSTLVLLIFRGKSKRILTFSFLWRKWWKMIKKRFILSTREGKDCLHWSTGVRGWWQSMGA